ncbi:hypothetical protein EsH8_III_000516 [Colletotrichum jinshuiense]
MNQQQQSSSSPSRQNKGHSRGLPHPGNVLEPPRAKARNAEVAGADGSGDVSGPDSYSRKRPDTSRLRCKRNDIYRPVIQRSRPRGEESFTTRDLSPFTCWGSSADGRITSSNPSPQSEPDDEKKRRANSPQVNKRTLQEPPEALPSCLVSSDILLRTGGPPMSSNHLSCTSN